MAATLPDMAYGRVNFMLGARAGNDLRKPERRGRSKSGHRGWERPVGKRGNTRGNLARLAGIEPTTLGFGGQYSIH